MRPVVPRSSRRFPVGVLGRGNDLEILILQLLVNLLPAWQIEAAASPGSPGNHQDLFAAEIGKVNYTAFSIRDREVRRDSSAIKISTNHRDFAETPGTGMDDHGLTQLACEAGEVEPLTVLKIFRDRNAHVGTTGALRFQLEFVDAREVGRAHPEILRIGPGF